MSNTVKKVTPHSVFGELFDVRQICHLFYSFYLVQKIQCLMGVKRKARARAVR